MISQNGHYKVHRVQKVSPKRQLPKHFLKDSFALSEKKRKKNSNTQFLKKTVNQSHLFTQKMNLEICQEVHCLNLTIDLKDAWFFPVKNVKYYEKHLKKEFLESTLTFRSLISPFLAPSPKKEQERKRKRKKKWLEFFDKFLLKYLCYFLLLLLSKIYLKRSRKQ